MIRNRFKKEEEVRIDWWDRVVAKKKKRMYKEMEARKRE